jgi:hypothetical protein
VACPFFMPVEKLENGSWLHAHRLPLGCGWSGHCTAPGHEGEIPSAEDLHQFCNLGYAESCGRLPRERPWDSIRFSARSLSINNENGSSRHVQLRYVCERAHLPAEHGMLEFDAATSQWQQRHLDGRLQRMAECFLASYMEKRNKQEASTAVAS